MICEWPGLSGPESAAPEWLRGHLTSRFGSLWPSEFAIARRVAASHGASAMVRYLKTHITPWDYA